MKLYWSGASPYARKVTIVAHELGLDGRIELLDGSGTPAAPNPGTAAYNPLGKLPCLVPADGPAIFDSRVICQYLIGQVEDQTLLPQAGSARFAALTLEALADGICDAALLLRYEGMRDEAQRSPGWIDGQSGKIDRALDALEQRWMPHLQGRFDLGHAAVGAALGYLSYRFAERGWRGAHPGLAAWQDGFDARDSARATAPTG